MRAVVLRAMRAKVTVKAEIVGEIGNGLVVLVGIAREDTKLDAAYLAEKVFALFIRRRDAAVAETAQRKAEIRPLLSQKKPCKETR